jgi:hypothetical protein
VVCGVDAPCVDEPCAAEFELEPCPAEALPVADPLEPALCAITHAEQQRRTTNVWNFCEQFIVVSPLGSD